MTYRTSQPLHPTEDGKAKTTAVKTTSSKRKNFRGSPIRKKTVTSDDSYGVYSKTKTKFVGDKKKVTKTFKHDVYGKKPTTKTKKVENFKFGSSGRPLGGSGGPLLGINNDRGVDHTKTTKKKVTTFNNTRDNKRVKKQVKRIRKQATPKKGRSVYSSK